MALTSVQKRAIKLKDVATKKVLDKQLDPFFKGNIPCFADYKKMNIEEGRARKIASYGYLRAKKELNVELHFTQSLIVGAAVLGTHHKILTVLPSQYGKSFLSACIALLLAADGESVSVAANDSDLTKKIMDEVWVILPHTSAEFKSKLTESADKIERGQTSLSKNRVGFVGGGFVSGLTLGGKYNDPLTGNKAVGQSGNFIIDESALVPDANYSETGRSEVGYRKDGRPYISIEMSNPHTINHFYRDMMQDPIEEGTLIVWADVRISIEEEKQIFHETDDTKPIFETTKFFKNEEKCLSYYLCDFGNVSDGSFFTTRPTVDNSPVDLSQGAYVLGLDSANRGADAIMACILQFPTDEKQYLRVVEITNLKPMNWKDFETPQIIEDLVVQLCKKINIVAIVMDLGGGEYLYDRLGNRFAKEEMDVALKGVYFNNSTTKKRIRPGFTGEDGTANGAELGVNKRAEMYLDLRDLIQTKSIRFTQKVTDQLQDEMNALGKELYTTGGKIQLEDKTRFVKKRLGRSPDALDATVLASHAYILFQLGLIGENLIELY